MAPSIQGTVIETSRNIAFGPDVGRSNFRVDGLMKNGLAFLVAALIFIGVGFALYKLDDGRGHRSDPSIANKTASD